MTFNNAHVSILLGTTLLLSNPAIAEEADLGELSQRIGEHYLILDNNSSECELVVGTEDKTRLALTLKSPCYWVTKPDSSEAQNYSYEDISHVLLVAGTPLDWDDEKKEHQKLPIDTYCSNYFQGITIKSSVVTVTDKTMDAPNCIGQAVDEKAFNAVILQTDNETDIEEPETEKGLLDNIKKTLKSLFTSDSDDSSSD